MPESRISPPMSMAQKRRLAEIEDRRRQSEPYCHGRYVKVVLLGAQGVGKTNFMMRFARGQFSLETKHTTGTEFCTTSINIENQKIRLEVWGSVVSKDGRFRGETTGLRLRGGQIIFLMYDLANGRTFEDAKKLLPDIREYFPGATVMLVGNKADLRHLREVTTEEAKQWAAENNIMFSETSALWKPSEVTVYGKSHLEWVVQHACEYHFERLASKTQRISYSARDSTSTDIREGASDIGFNIFKTAYYRAYNSAFFKNPFSTMKGRLDKGLVYDMSSVYTYAKENPRSRTAKVLRSLI